MQHTWSTATIEISPYKDPCHCKNWLATLATLWLPLVYFGIRDWLDKTPARADPDYLIDNTGNIHKFTTTVLSWEFLMPLMATGDFLTDV